MSEIYAGMWDFDGSCAPSEDGETGRIYTGQEGFSLACFQWVPRSGGRGFKKGKVQHRIKGRVADPAPAYAAARAFCERKNAEVDA